MRSEVARRAVESSGESWVLAERSDGAIVVANAAAKPIDHPYAATRLTIRFDRGIEHMAGTELKADIEAAEDRLVEALAATETVQLGHVTERRRRSTYVMCRDAEATRAITDAWVRAEARWSPKVDIRDDPGWTVRGELGI